MTRTPSPAPVATGPRPSGSRRRWRRVALAAVGVAALALAAKVLYDSSDEVLAAADILTHPRWEWVGVALLAEAVSYLLRGGAQAVLLRTGLAGAAPGPLVLSAGSLAGDAAAYCLPFGFAASGVVMVGVLRQRGVPTTVGGWMYAVNATLYVASISVITVLAVQVAGRSDPVPGLWQVSLGVLGLLVLLALGYVAARRYRRRHPAARRSIGARTARVRGWLASRLAELRAIRLPTRTGAAAFGLLTASWFASIAVLAVAYPAVGAAPPWAGLLLAFCASQIAAAVPVTPGGVGVVEGSLTLALVAFGGAQTVTLAAVLLYRLVTYWACIPLGGLAWLVLRATSGVSRGGWR